MRDLRERRDMFATAPPGSPSYWGDVEDGDAYCGDDEGAVDGDVDLGISKESSLDVAKRAWREILPWLSAAHVIAEHDQLRRLHERESSRAFDSALVVSDRCCYCWITYLSIGFIGARRRFFVATRRRRRFLDADSDPGLGNHRHHVSSDLFHPALFRILHAGGESVA